MSRFGPHSHLLETVAALEARARELDGTPDMGRRSLVILGRALKPDIRRALLDAIDGGELQIADPSAVIYHALQDAA